MTAPATARLGNRALAATVHAAFPGWRAWSTSDGNLAARQGGAPPPGTHAHGASLPELFRAIQTASTASPPPVLRPAEQAVLDVLAGAPTPLPIRGVSDAAGQHLSATAKALAALRHRGLATRRRDGRAYLYQALA